MKFERMTIHNFRQYYDRQTIQFAKDAEKNVTVLHGINGAGKTSFFLAMNWCLYGRTVDDVAVISNVGELMSKEAIHQREPGDEVQTSVDLVFNHAGRRYTVQRALRGIKQENGEIAFHSPDDFIMMETSSTGQAKPVPNPIGMMNSILPANVREYFLFDGEKIDNFAKPEAAAQVRQAIYLVLDIEVLERAQRHLNDQAIEYRRQLKQISGGELRELVEQEEQIRVRKDKAEQRKSELEGGIVSAERKKNEVDERLQDIQDARALQQQRARLEQELKQRRRELDDTVSRLATRATAAHAALAIPATQKAVEILDQKRERGEIPSGIREQFVQDLMEQMTCICGRPFVDGSPEHTRLLNLLQSRLPGSIEDDILNTHALLKQIPVAANERQAELDDAMRRRADLIDILETLDGELDDVSRQLQGSPLEEISRLEERRQEFQSDIDNYNIEIGTLIKEISDYDEELSRLGKEINRAQKEQMEQRLLSTKRDLAQRSADAISEMHHLYADDMRQRIEVKTKEIFKQLIWKGTHFQDVRLGSDFNLEVIDRYGKPARPELSAGERQVLSLSFIAAMSEVSEEEAPLVMDTPFGRLSSHHRNSITERLPILADQLVLFVTDEELRDLALTNLQPRIGAEYRLNFDRTTSCTTIEQVS